MVVAATIFTEILVAPVYKNTFLMYLLKGRDTDTGNARETFLANQVGCENTLELPPSGDFLVNGGILIEVGGKNKTSRQLRAAPHIAMENSFIAADNIEYGYGNKIPLWLFGFLY